MTVRKITLCMLVPVAIAYIGRVLIHLYLDFNRDSIAWAYLWFLWCPVVVMLGILVLLIAIFTAHKAQSPTPAVILISGLMLIPFLPLPPLPSPVFPEEAFFYEHRTEYDQVIQLVRRDNLGCVENLGCSYTARELPTEYRELSKDGVFHITNGNSSHLLVTFYPLGSYYPIIYFAIPEDSNHLFGVDCRIDCGSRRRKRLEENWYLCFADWD